MVLTSKLQGYEQFKSFKDKIEGDGNVFIYFTGSKNENGESWCPDCVEAEPFVLKAVDKYCSEDSSFVIVDVGDRAFWKDMKNPFRLNKNVHLSVIPTLVRWKNPQRLEGDQCQKEPLLEMFFTEDD